MPLLTELFAYWLPYSYKDFAPPELVHPSILPYFHPSILPVFHASDLPLPGAGTLPNGNVTPSLRQVSSSPSPFKNEQTHILVRPQRAAICVIDDDASTSNALVRFLTVTGLDTIAFQRPRLFLEYAKHHPVALAIIDISMPELTGLEVQRRLGEISPEVPVIIMTGQTDNSMKKAIALKQGAIAFLLKPIRGVALLSAIRTVLAPQRVEE
jgi:CheY-like chemotaxis protein